MEENFEKAYQKLKKAESNCKLLNIANEQIYLAVLSEKFGKKEDAFIYLDKLLKEGFPFEELEKKIYISSLAKYEEWNVLKEKSKEYEKHFDKRIDYELREELLELNNYHNELFRPNYHPSIIKKLDSLIEKRLKIMLTSKGYPVPELIGYNDVLKYDILRLLTRVKDTSYFRQVLIGYVKRGKGHPYSIAAMIDGNYLNVPDSMPKARFIYGFAVDMDSTYIKDFRNVDKRRISIGLRPWNLRARLMELYKVLYPSFYE
ncbi:MAG: hypothetical protein WBM55_02320 [Muriicola sp.]